MSATSHLERPTPGTGSGADGAVEIRHRVTAADGSASGSSFGRRQRRSSRAVVPPSSAANCSRRVAVMPTRATSPTTAVSPVAQSLLHDGEGILVASRVNLYEPRRRDARLAQRRGEEVGVRHDPEDRRLAGSRGDAGREQRGRGVVGKARGRTRHLVECGGDDSASREPPINFRYSEGNTRHVGPADRSKRSDFGARRVDALEAREGDGGHDAPTTRSG